MKRPFAVIGFSMLMTFLAVTNITHKMTIALLIGAVVIFSCFLLFKPLRKYLSVIFALFGVIVFTISFISAEKYYMDETTKTEKEQKLTGVVCQTPTSSDYAFSYIIKVNEKNYKIRFVSQSDIFLEEGDCVAFTVANHDSNENLEFLENSLSSRIYFTYFSSDDCTIEKTGETNFYYKNIGAVKRLFSEIIMNYLPGRNGAIAKAMTIGDKSEIDDNITNLFNYCGTSHLLVVSGLHLTLWSFGIIKILNKFSRLRKYSPYIGLICLFLYSSITGFSVSVLRAGAMVGTALLGRILRRGADSINAIGLALAFILVSNPFAPFSVSLWFTVFSTMGILAYSGNIQSWIIEKTQRKFISKIPLFSTVVTGFVISFSTTVFTLPIFVFNFRMMPVASVVANIIMVDAAMILMLLTVLGVLSHLLFLFPIARCCFFVTGVLGEFLHITAEKIGMASWSTISLNHKYYKYFLLLLVVSVFAVFVAKKCKLNILKPVTAALTAIFILTAFGCTLYDYNTPSVEIVSADSEPVIIVNSKGKSVLLGLQDKNKNETIKERLNYHNKKQLDAVVVTESNGETVAEIINLYNNFGVTDLYFCGEAQQLFSEFSKSYVTGFTMDENVQVSFEQDETTEIFCNGKSLLIMNCEKAENYYEKKKKYDIIILYGENSVEFAENLKAGLNNTQVIAIEQYKAVSVYF